MADVKYKRKKILVDPGLQFGLSIAMLGWIYFYVIMFALVVNVRSIWAIFTASATDPSYFEAVQRFQWFLRFAAVPLACMFLCVAAHGVIFAHRLAGPMVRIKATLRGVADRKYPQTPVRLRPKDFFKDVAAEMSTMIDALREDAARGRRMNQETIAAAREALEAASAGRLSGPEMVALAQATLDRAERFDRHLATVLEAPADSPTPTPASTASADAMSVTS